MLPDEVWQDAKRLMKNKASWEVLEACGLPRAKFIKEWRRRQWAKVEAGEGQRSKYRRVRDLVCTGWDYDVAIALVGMTSAEFREERKRRRQMKRAEEGATQ